MTTVDVRRNDLQQTIRRIMSELDVPDAPFVSDIRNESFSEYLPVYCANDRKNVDAMLRIIRKVPYLKGKTDAELLERRIDVVFDIPPITKDTNFSYVGSLRGRTHY